MGADNMKGLDAHHYAVMDAYQDLMRMMPVVGLLYVMKFGTNMENCLQKSLIQN